MTTDHPAPAVPLARRSGVARPMVELVDDCACDSDHTVCIRLSVAASWPEPHPWHDLGE